MNLENKNEKIPEEFKHLAQDFRNNQLRLGRGLIFHICPSNVPTNFAYSFFFGLSV